MRPQLNEMPDDGKGKPKRKIEPEILKEEDNDVLLRLTRSGASGIANILAEFIACDNFDGSGDFKGQKIEVGIEIKRSEDDFEERLPRLEMPSRIDLPPVLCCRGVSPSHADTTRPHLNAWPTPIAATKPL